jgi:phage protein D
VSNTAAAVDFDIKVNGNEIPDGDVIAFAVDMDLNQPDMCVITLRNQNHGYNDKFKPGHSVEIQIGGDTRNSDDGGSPGAKPTIFKGELVGLEPSYRQGGESKMVLRAFNKLHRLTRGKKSKTYQKQSDQDICSAIAGLHGLSATTGSTPKIKHEHVYQHNQTDLEFLRTRAARIGYAVWVEDTKLFFDAPKLDKDSGIELKLDKDAAKKLKSFSGRLSNAMVVKKVTVRGWDPQKKAEIVGEVSAKSSPLGSSNAASSLSDFGEVVTFTVDHPIFSVEEAKAIAQSKLDEFSMSYLTAEAESMGINTLKPGIVIKIVVNQDTATDSFNGKYLVQGCSHRFSQSKGGEGGYVTGLRLTRDASKGS